jgi:ABC-2 type transport system ATP-binding protein
VTQHHLPEPTRASDAAAPAIETVDLGRDYGNTTALRSLTLSIPPGALVGLLGPNGAGKTTAMLLLATLIAPSRGSARILGHDVVRERTAVRRRLGLVFQEPSVDGLLTVEENLQFAAGLVGLRGPAAQTAVAAALERTGLMSQSARPARQLSGGWRRLTDIARATLHRPDLLILDEPTVSLDPEHRELMWSLVQRERRERGATVLFSTHYLAEAESCDLVVMLAKGEAMVVDTPAALMATIGEQVLEIEGPDAERAARVIAHSSQVRVSVRTERGYRLGISGARDDMAAIFAAAPRLTRLDVRRVTLEDVYFARTQPAADAAGARPGR